MAHAWKACWVHALGGSNPPSSASLTRANAGAVPSAVTAPGGSVSVSVSVRVYPHRSTLLFYPDQPADALGDVAADWVGDVLVSLGHRCGRPAHDAHRGSLVDTEQEQDRRS